MTTLLTNELKSFIGAEASYTAPDEVGRAAIRHFASALQDRNELYHDDDFARQTRFQGIVAPPTFVCESNQYVTEVVDEDGYTGHTWHLPIPPSRIIRVGNDYEFFASLRPSDRITASWRLVNITERTTRRGAMIFVDSEVRYTNQHGCMLAINRETVAFQPLPHSIENGT